MRIKFCTLYYCPSIKSTVSTVNVGLKLKRPDTVF